MRRWWWRRASSHRSARAEAWGTGDSRSVDPGRGTTHGVLDDPDGELRAAVQAKARQDTPYVVGRRAFGHRERTRDLRVGAPFRDQHGDLPLARRQGPPGAVRVGAVGAGHQGTHAREQTIDTERLADPAGAQAPKRPRPLAVPLMATT